jgi:hypothetical protein
MVAVKESIWSKLLGKYRNEGYFLELDESEKRFKLMRNGEFIAGFSLHESIFRIHQYIESLPRGYGMEN